MKRIIVIYVMFLFLAWLISLGVELIVEGSLKTGVCVIIINTITLYDLLKHSDELKNND